MYIYIVSISFITNRAWTLIILKHLLENALSLGSPILNNANHLVIFFHADAMSVGKDRDFNYYTIIVTANCIKHVY